MTIIVINDNLRHFIGDNNCHPNDNHCEQNFEKWYHHYTQCLKENEAKENDGELMITLDEAEYDFLVRRSKFDRGLKEVIDDDEN